MELSITKVFLFLSGFASLDFFKVIALTVASC